MNLLHEPKPIKPPPLLRLAGISKVYGTEANPLTVLSDFNLDVAEGEFVAIVGPSGAGKSTLLNIVGCLDRPTTGSYELLGEDVARLDDERLSHVRRTRIGFVFQSFQLIAHLSVIENVEMPMFYARMPKRQRRKRCEELIEQVGLGERGHHRPRELSGGECQRVAIARAMANDPAILLADEPTGNLDTKTSDEIMGLIHKLHDSGRTIVLITHNHEIAEAAPRRVALTDGKKSLDTYMEPKIHVHA